MRSSEDGHPVARSRGPLASVRPDCRDWHVATVPVVELTDLHWDRSSPSWARGGDATLCAFTSCDAVVAGELPHPAAAHPHPHAVRVCIFREDNDRVVFDRLLLEAGPRPRRYEDLRADARAAGRRAPAA